MRIKTDGHTHTEYCPHGSGEYAEEMIRRAIELGYENYSITEHAPLPEEFLLSDVSKIYAMDDFNMKSSEVEHYLKSMHRLKDKYKSEINIKVGFEFDYIEDYEEYLRDFLDEYHGCIDDSIISVHYLKGSGGLRAIDFSPCDFKEGILDFYGSFKDVENAYFKTIAALIKADLGEYKPRRIGHITIYRKFEKYNFGGGESIPKASIPDFIAQMLLEKNIQLDYNLSGYKKPYLKDSYPPAYLLDSLTKKGIILVPGSDAHSSKELWSEEDLALIK